ncbi:CBS domain-containing protein [Shewanella avicenniae]|uniref:CBS domain-containing protein n=1 Tax=Shewanella avicenniae TaxID=2814294 RepID=A0ABX7QUR6_9GAMM|nr:CBS domain-containing protein [Shewanella avicenniae]QSX35184.1 CBS domain-containing protein [Shewanella avicenniae]
MESLRVQDYMDRFPVKLSADMTIAQAVELLLKERKPGAPVVAPNGHLVGFLSQQDCMGAMLKSSYYCDLADMVKDRMRTDVLTVSPDHSMLLLAEQMLGQKPKIYPVVDHGQVVGVIDRSNVLAAINSYMKQCYMAPA